MQRVSYATIKRRKGTGLLPPNNKQWNIEHHALDLREELNLEFNPPLDHLDAFDLLPGAIVVPHGKVPAAYEFLDHFRNAGRGNWSGMAVPIGPSQEWVIYNDAHSLTRIRATLMEEFFHIRFGHPCSEVRLLSTDGKHRTMNPSVEAEAYHTGAAALLPYAALRSGVEDGLSVQKIAEGFQVSPALVEFRAKVTKLYTKLNRRRWSRR